MKSHLFALIESHLLRLQLNFVGVAFSPYTHWPPYPNTPDWFWESPTTITTSTIDPQNLFDVMASTRALRFASTGITLPGSSSSGSKPSTMSAAMIAAVLASNRTH